MIDFESFYRLVLINNALFHQLTQNMTTDFFIDFTYFLNKLLSKREKAHGRGAKLIKNTCNFDWLEKKQFDAIFT